MLPQPKLGLLCTDDKQIIKAEWANDTIVQKFKLGYFQFESCKVRCSILECGKDRRFDTQPGPVAKKCNSKAYGW